MVINLTAFNQMKVIDPPRNLEELNQEGWLWGKTRRLFWNHSTCVDIYSVGANPINYQPSLGSFAPKPCWGLDMRTKHEVTQMRQALPTMGLPWHYATWPQRETLMLSSYFLNFLSGFRSSDYKQLPNCLWKPPFLWVLSYCWLSLILGFYCVLADKSWIQGKYREMLWKQTCSCP